MFPKPGKSFDPALIPRAIQDAGFTAMEVVVMADGTTVKKGQLLELEVPGLQHPFVLNGGAQADALKKRADLVGKNIRVNGKLYLRHADRPSGLTVETFEIPAK